MLMDILLVVDGIISVHSRGTGQLMPMNTYRLAEGDYDVICPRGESDSDEIIRNQANFVRKYQTNRGDLRATTLFS
jgi:hypothetical protein